MLRRPPRSTRTDALFPTRRSFVLFADRAAVRALHVVGEDVEFGLGVGGRSAVEQRRRHVLLAVGLLCLARDRDLAQVSAGGGAAENRAHPLPRGRAGLGMGYGGDDFEHLLAPADLRRAEREIGAFVEGDVELDAAIGAADVEHMQLGNRTLAKGELY